MKKLFFLSFIFLSSIFFVKAQVGYFGNPDVTDGLPNYSTALGTGNTSNNYYTFVGGSNSSATGSHSFGFGQNVVSNGTGSFALGKYVVTGQDNSWVIGTGTGPGKADIFENSYANSLAIGFNTTTTPSIFVTPFTTTFGTTDGEVGIHTWTPRSTFDVNGTLTTTKFNMTDGAVDGHVLTYDATNEEAVWTDPSTIGGGSEGYWDANGSDIFYNGDVGIGSDANPTGKLHVFGVLKSTDYYQFDQVAGEIRYGKADLSSSFKIRRYKDGVSGKSEDPDYWKDVLVIDNMERIGIGTDTPSEELEVVGTIKSTGLQVTGGNLGAGYVLSDINGDGNAHWVDIGTMSGVGVWDENGSGDVAHYMGAVGIGTSSVGTHKLVVNGSINATLIKVTETVPQSDYVFESDYELMSLSDLEQYIKTHKHLPEVMSAEEFARDGYSLGEMDDILLRKVEELTLYVIDQDKTIKKQQELLDKQQQLIDQLLEAKK